MPKPLATLVSIWTWLSVALLVITCCAVQMLLAPLTWPWDRQRRVTGRIFRVMCGVWPTVFCPVWRFRIDGAVPAQLPKRMIVISNHESHLDPFLISRLPWEMKWLSKASIFKIPFVGWGMRMAGDIKLYRGDRASALSALAECKRRVEAGMPVMIFPEGTRSKTSELLPFKEGAFRLAIETGATLLPIAVYGTRQALPKHSWRISGARAWVTVGEPILTTGLRAEDATRLAETARAQIEGMRARLASL